MFSEKANIRLRSLRSVKAVLAYFFVLWGPIDWVLGKVGDVDTVREHWPQVQTMLTHVWTFFQTLLGYVATLVFGIAWLAYLVIRSEAPKPKPIAAGQSEKEAQFLSALTELSRRHGIGIGTQHELFVMEIGGERDDFNRAYKIDPQVGLLFD